MLVRELSKPGAARVWQIIQDGTWLIEECENGGSRHTPSPDLQRATAEFNNRLATKEKEGWRETERSISRRVFRSTGTSQGKFWIIWLDEHSVIVQFGKIPKAYISWTTRSGQTKTKDFPNRAKALQAYERMIAGKLVEGYDEIHQRKTEYSHLGQELAKKDR